MTFKIPENQEGVAVEMSTVLIGKELDAYVKQHTIYFQKKARMYNIVLGKCNEKMKNQLEGEIRFKLI